VIVFVLQPRTWFMSLFGDRRLRRLIAPVSGHARARSFAASEKKYAFGQVFFHFVSSLYFFNNTLLYSS